MISKRFIYRENAKSVQVQQRQITSMERNSCEVALSIRTFYSALYCCPFSLSLLMSIFSVVAYYLWCGTLFSRCRISVYQYIAMCRIVATCYISRVATQPHYISPLLSVAQYFNLIQCKCEYIVYCVYSDDSSANYSALLGEGSGHIFQHLVGGFGWSHIRDDGAGVEEEDQGERGRDINAVEAVGVG